MKTNEWIKSDKYSMYYLTDGRDIYGAAEMKDGSRDSEEFDVDYHAFDIGKGQYEFTEEMIKLFGVDAVKLYPIKFFPPRV